MYCRLINYACWLPWMKVRVTAQRAQCEWSFEAGAWVEANGRMYVWTNSCLFCFIFYCFSEWRAQRIDRKGNQIVHSADSRSSTHIRFTFSWLFFVCECGKLLALDSGHTELMDTWFRVSWFREFHWETFNRKKVDQTAASRIRAIKTAGTSFAGRIVK